MKLPQVNPPAGKPAGSYKRKVCPPLAWLTRFELRKEVTFQVSGGSCFPVTLLAKSLRIFTDLAVGETAASLREAKVECGGGRNATTAKSLKIPAMETPK